MSDNNNDQQADQVVVDESKTEKLKAVFDAAYANAEMIFKSGDTTPLKTNLNDDLFQSAWELGGIVHAARGVALTLCAYKIVAEDQDIRIHKADHEGGFSARSFDTAVTVPFLQSLSLPYNSQTHWLSQTFSFTCPYHRNTNLKTKPQKAGPLMVKVVNEVEESQQPRAVAEAVATVILYRLIEERDKGKVSLEKPKELQIDLVVELLHRHFNKTYSKNAPRLPQIAIYAIYSCIVNSMERYQGLELQPLERMKTANRKTGSVGDIDVNRGKQPEEAVEVKLGIEITEAEVNEAIEKIRHASVSRYLILSTAGISKDHETKIKQIQYDFRRANGCEIIVNGVIDTIKYYLRLIRSTTDFIYAYTTIVETDPDVSYEHRQAWNDVCKEVLG